MDHAAEPVTPTHAATLIAERVQRIDHAADGSIREIEFADGRGSAARVRVDDGGLACEGLATLWPVHGAVLGFRFDCRETPGSPEERTLLQAVSRTPRGLEMAFMAARNRVEATVMLEAQERCEADLRWTWERVLPPDDRPGGGWITESVADLEHWLLDRLPPFGRSATFGRGAERVARSAWCHLMIVAIHEEQARRMRAVEVEERGAPGFRGLH